jgi:hypothetical protein
MTLRDGCILAWVSRKPSPAYFKPKSAVVGEEEEATLRSNRLTAYFSAYVSNEGAMLRQLHIT